MAAFHCEGVLCRRAPQCDLRDPGRGDPGFRRCWVMCFAGHLRKILLCCLGFLFLSWAWSFNSPAHQLLWFFGAVLSVLSLLALVGFLFALCVLLVFCLVSVSSCGLTRLRTDLSMLHFRTPKEGYSVCTCVIRSLSTTMCDDLARATEAQDGKKSGACQLLNFSFEVFTV